MPKDYLTVGELIAELQKYVPECVVAVKDTYVCGVDYDERDGEVMLLTA